MGGGPAWRGRDVLILATCTSPGCSKDRRHPIRAPSPQILNRRVPHLMNEIKNLKRCAWSDSDALMRAYHDEEWGVPLHDSRALWEMLMLEGFQAGLSWITVLRKRDTFREAFAGFDADKVACFNQRDIERLMKNEGIIRARAKIDATIAGAGIFCEMREQGEDFAKFCWSFTDG